MYIYTTDTHTHTHSFKVASFTPYITAQQCLTHARSVFSCFL